MVIKILIPVFNDWQSVIKLVSEINNLSIDSKFEVSILIVNDGSSHDRQEEDKNLENIHSIKILNMKALFLGLQTIIIERQSRHQSNHLLER